MVIRWRNMFVLLTHGRFDATYFAPVIQTSWNSQKSHVTPTIKINSNRCNVSCDRLSQNRIQQYHGVSNNEPGECWELLGNAVKVLKSVSDVLMEVLHMDAVPFTLPMTHCKMLHIIIYNNNTDSKTRLSPKQTPNQLANQQQQQNKRQQQQKTA